MLGDFGADVVKLEPRSGDPMRRMGQMRGGRSLGWAMVARNKRAITLDLERKAGLEIFHRLVGHADVLVENFPRSLLERWRATWEELSVINPRLVMVSVSGFGASGPYAGRAAAGTLAEAFAGLTHMTGEADGPPMLTSLPVGDVMTAISGVVGALAACYHRDARGGSGQHVDVSMYEPVLQLLSGSVAGFQPGDEPPHRMGSRVAGGVPRNTYRTADAHWVVVSATTDPQVARVLRCLGLDDERHRARFARAEDRTRAADELDALVAAWISARDREFVLATFSRERIPASPVNDLADFVADPHVEERSSLVLIDDAHLGPVCLVAPTPRLSATPGQIQHTGPTLGEHNAEVYREWIGIGEEELSRLVESGLV